MTRASSREHTRQTVLDDHEQQHGDQADQAGGDALAHRVGAQRRADRAAVHDFQGHGQAP